MRCFFIVLCCFCAAHLAHAKLSGESTTLAWQAQNSQGKQVASMLQRVRLQWQDDWQSLYWAVDYDTVALCCGIVKDPLFTLQKQRSPSTYVDLQAPWYDQSPWYISHQLYRGWLQYQRNDGAITIGRQRIAWGTGRLWNPTDRFNPVLPTALEPNEKTGVDALNMRWNYSGFGSLQAVFAAGRTAYGLPKKTALRWQDTWLVGDVSIVGLSMNGQHYMGMDYASNIGDAGIHIEGLQGWRNNDSQWVAGVDGTWLMPWLAEPLSLGVEYLYNAMPARNGLSSRSHQLLGFNAGYTMSTLWQWDVIIIEDLEQASMAILPTLTWSLAQDVDLQGSSWWFTRNKGEFSGVNTLLSVRMQWYF